MRVTFAIALTLLLCACGSPRPTTLSASQVAANLELTSRYTGITTGTVALDEADVYLAPVELELTRSLFGLGVQLARPDPRTLVVQWSTSTDTEAMDTSIDRVANALLRYWQTTAQITGRQDAERGAAWLDQELQARRVPPSRIRVAEASPEEPLAVYIRPIVQPVPPSRR